MPKYIAIFTSNKINAKKCVKKAIEYMFWVFCIMDLKSAAGKMNGLWTSGGF